jgi:hypothetical protein
MSPTPGCTASYVAYTGRVNLKKSPNTYRIFVIQDPDEGGWNSSVGVETCYRLDGFGWPPVQQGVFYSPIPFVTSLGTFQAAVRTAWNGRALVLTNYYPLTQRFTLGTPVPLISLCAYTACALVSLLVDVYNIGNLEHNPANEFQSPLPAFTNIQSEI